MALSQSLCMETLIQRSEYKLLFIVKQIATEWNEMKHVIMCNTFVVYLFSVVLVEYAYGQKNEPAKGYEVPKAMV